MAFWAKKKKPSKEEISSVVFVAVKPDVRVKVSALVLSGIKESYHMVFDGGVYVAQNDLEYKILLGRSKNSKDIAPVSVEKLKEALNSLGKKQSPPKMGDTKSGLEIFDNEVPKKGGKK